MAGRRKRTETQEETQHRSVLRAVIAAGESGLTAKEMVTLVPDLTTDALSALVEGKFLGRSTRSDRYIVATPFGRAWLALREM